MLVRIPRADQRRWGEIYIRGLISLAGRKSLRRIAELIADDNADQALQQFVNQSPWDWRPVRGDLARYAESRTRPSAWVIADFALPKNGSASVGVERQYAHSLGRVINCQTGVSLFLIGDEASIPVNWRLRLPQSWNEDRARRERAHLPERELHRSRWEYVISMIDETLAWGLAPAPIIIDSSHDLQIEQLARALEQRSLRYVVRVGSGALVAAGSGPGEPALTAGAVAAQLRQSGDAAVLRTTGAGPGGGPARFALCRLPAAGGSRDPRSRPRFLLVGSTPGHLPSGLWLTNLGGVPVPQQVGLTGLVSRVSGEMERIRDRFGLGHFEGRSFRGWHHHATLVGLAQAFVAGRRPVPRLVG
jgi:SRSO17 transposase